MSSSPRLLLCCVLFLSLGACEECSSDDNPFEPQDAGKVDMHQDASPDMSQDMPADMAPDTSPDMAPVDLGPIPETDAVFTIANSCVTISARSPQNAASVGSLSASDNTYVFSTTAPPVRVLMRASDLGTYLLFDNNQRYVVVEEGDAFIQKETLSSDILMIEDGFLPGAQWTLHASPRDPSMFNLQHLKTGRYMTATGIRAGIEHAALISFEPAEDCANFPELTLDASGEVYAEPFEDGSVFGIVDTHSHILSNFGFGGGGLFHGSAFHPLGVEHALPSCELFHGEEGRKDLFGFGFDQGDSLDQQVLLQGLIQGSTPEFNHFTQGYPEFTDWPNAPSSATHQTQYYRWLERAYMGGLRLMVQHATSNKIICDLIVGQGTQDVRYACDDMVAVDRIIDETRRMERYIDAQHGGPGKGWFRVVTSPQQARDVINDGKLAIVLGIEVSHLFDCFIVPPEGTERCTEADVISKLDAYWDKGVRVIFPVHKYDNGFSAGDGDRNLIEVGNFAQSGHWSNFTQDCPDLPSVFDKGRVDVGGLNMPRDDYFSDPPNNLARFPDRPVTTLLRYAGKLTDGPIEGDHCQNAGLTELGEFLMMEMMRRGIIIEIDHLPRRSYARAFEMLTEQDYPAVGTHGNNNRGKLYELGGVSKVNFGRCSDPSQPGGMLSSFKNRLALIEQAGGFPAEGFGFDLNGFAGGPRPRFGESSRCDVQQENPVLYPFTSVDGAITFTQPVAGSRQLDFNTEGMAHIGLLPELIEDARRDGATDEDLEPLFKSAEGYIRMWERSEARAKVISGE